MDATRGPLVLATADVGLRSLLSARLGMAGEMPISTANYLDPSLGNDTRATALLIVEGCLITGPRVDWSKTLRDQRWRGQIIIIADTVVSDMQHDQNILLVNRSNAGVAVPALVQLWQIGSPVMSPE